MNAFLHVLCIWLQGSCYCSASIHCLMVTQRRSQLSPNKYRNWMKLIGFCLRARVWMWPYVLSQYLPWERVAQLHIAWGHAAGSSPALQWSSQRGWWTRPCPRSRPSFSLDLQTEMRTVTYSCYITPLWLILLYDCSSVTHLNLLPYYVYACHSSLSSPQLLLFYLRLKLVKLLPSKPFWRCR